MLNVVNFFFQRTRLQAQSSAESNVISRGWTRSYREVVNCHLSLLSPERRSVHKGKTVPARNQARDVVERALRVYSSFFIEKVVDSFAVEEHDNGGRAKLQGVDASILLAPEFQPA
jgi:hypothetical protein